MNSLLDSDRDEDVDDRHSRSSYRGGQDREITLGTTMVLAIFFALAVFGAVFFGFGYSMGAKHAAANTGMAVGVGSSTSFSTFKPAPGSPIGAPAGKPADGSAAATTAAFVTPTPVPVKPLAVKPAVVADAPAADPVVVAVPAVAKTGKPAAPVSTPSTQIAGEFMVQVAASSHEEDAETVVSALKRRGYNVAIHSEPQDKYFHVQIGPFATKADAIAMSKKVAADGFNSIVK